MHPYKELQADAFWRKAVAAEQVALVDPVGMAKFKLSRQDRVATAGSCFAQHIARYLDRSGFNYLVTESAHPLIPEHISAPFGYKLFTARYGNIYTSRQMVQLLHRAYGKFQPQDDIWINETGLILDPFRPQIQPGGFSSVAEFHADRAQHFAAIRAAVETLDCFVFTLGLTECWMARSDGAVYPICPGVSGGEFDPSRHMFHNMTVSEVLSDLAEIVDFIRDRNGSARFMLTVSPVPLVATASGEHVLAATTLSKSILRAAAGEFARSLPHVAYFPSYEVITGNYTRGIYYGEDLRSVTEMGVSHVMRLFMQHYGDVASDAELPRSEPERPVQFDTAEIIKVICEEEALQITLDE